MNWQSEHGTTNHELAAMNVIHSLSVGLHVNAERKKARICQRIALCVTGSYDGWYDQYICHKDVCIHLLQAPRVKLLMTVCRVNFELSKHNFLYVCLCVYIKLGVPWTERFQANTRDLGAAKVMQLSQQ